MLQTLKDSLAAVRAGRIDTDRLIALWRDQASLLGRLPPSYGQVLDDLLMRIESSRLFSGTACAFDRDDLIAALATWLDKAEGFLAHEKEQGAG
jgi:hypothetical protein